MHTPAPWKLITYGVDDPHDWAVFSAKGRFIADFPGLIWDEREQQAADCRLIAAAPDLLAALHNMLEDGDATDRHQAIAAIEKATGLRK